MDAMGVVRVGMWLGNEQIQRIRQRQILSFVLNPTAAAEILHDPLVTSKFVLLSEILHDPFYSVLP